MYIILLNYIIIITIAIITAILFDFFNNFENYYFVTAAIIIQLYHFELRSALFCALRSLFFIIDISW